MLFCKEKRPLVVKKHPDADFSDIARYLGEEWKQATKEEKEKYNSQALILREKYKEEKSDFEKSKNKKKRNQRNHLIRTRVAVRVKTTAMTVQVRVIMKKRRKRGRKRKRKKKVVKKRKRTTKWHRRATPIRPVSSRKLPVGPTALLIRRVGMIRQPQQHQQRHLRRSSGEKRRGRSKKRTTVKNARRRKIGSRKEKTNERSHDETRGFYVRGLVFFLFILFPVQTSISINPPNYCSNDIHQVTIFFSTK